MCMGDSLSSIRTLLFDMDNTLFDLEGAQAASCCEVARFLGDDDGGALYDYFLRPVRGFESHENIRDYIRDRNLWDDGTFRKACTIFEERRLQQITVYDHVAETLFELGELGYAMAIVTDAHFRDATKRLEKTGLLPFFRGMVTYDLIGEKKPSREPFLAALDMMRSEAHEALFIGDSPRRDIEPCRSLGIRTVYARYGDTNFSQGDRVNADFTIDSLKELLDILGTSR
ncbi:MAG: Phosphoglycolate phosphatase [Methanoregula sp. SKADARSKE-2]|nr:MAG: Phosphoglycolate phosphatase [Methanoregula sp. SKADARSKE-2]